MDSFAGLFLIYLVFLGALMSPGPDFLMIVRTALGCSARAGVFAALGIAVGNTVHISVSLAGLGLLIAQSVLLFNILKWTGAAYLAWIGIQSLRSKGTSLERVALPKAGGANDKTDSQAFVSGFITNIFNPKATMFFLALFSQMLDPQTPLASQLVFGAATTLTAFLWFSAVAMVMGVAPVRRAYGNASVWIDRIFGGFFIALAAKLALVRAG